MSEKYNSSSVLALKGRSSFIICGTTSYNNELKFVTRTHSNVFQMTNGIFLGCSGLYTDSQKFSSILRNDCEKFPLSHYEEICGRRFASLVSHQLYEKRMQPWYLSTLVAGFDAKGDPALFSTDNIGALCEEPYFAVCGSSNNQLMGICEGFYQAGLSDDELLVLARQIFAKATERDCLVGGMEAYLVNRSQIYRYEFETRED